MLEVVEAVDDVVVEDGPGTGPGMLVEVVVVDEVDVVVEVVVVDEVDVVVVDELVVGQVVVVVVQVVVVVEPP